MVLSQTKLVEKISYVVNNAIDIYAERLFCKLYASQIVGLSVETNCALEKFYMLTLLSLY